MITYFSNNYLKERNQTAIIKKTHSIPKCGIFYISNRNKKHEHTGKINVKLICYD